MDGLRLQFGEGLLAGTVNGDKEVLLAFFSLHFGKVNMQLA